MLFDSQPQAMVTVIDRSGRKSTARAGPGRLWIGVGAIGNRDLVHRARAPAKVAAAAACRLLAGVERNVHRAPDWLVLHDIAADGRVLLSRNTIRINAGVQAAR